MKTIGVSIAVILHTLGTAVYFWRMSNDPGQIYWKQFGWTVYFDCIMIMPLIILCFIFAFNFPKSMFDKELLIVEGVFSLSLFCAFILQNYGCIEHTYGYQLSLAAVGCTTLFILINGYRGGYYINYSDGN